MLHSSQKDICVFLSLAKTKTNWFPASFNEESLSVVYFNTSNPVGTYAYTNSTENADALFDEPPTNVGPT